MKGSKRLSLTAKLHSFFYFSFWGFYFSAGYLFCKKFNKSLVVSL
ncbi:hypothetical protein [Clostridium sp.]